MSGIAGFCDFTRDNTSPRWTGAGEKMGQILAPYGGGHRGQWACPESVLVYRGSGEGSQPLERPLGTARYAVSFTGKLEDADRTRRFLRSQGYRFTTDTDAEVLLYACMEFDREVVERLEGGYAFALWDGLRGKLLAGRGRNGTEKLFYVNCKDALVFSSEEEALWAYPAEEERAEGRQLHPGEWLVFDRNGIRTGGGG